MERKELLSRLKTLLHGITPPVEAILYGSEARGEAKPDSDIDILILVDKDKISPQEEDKITSPIYDLEIESGIVISPIVMTNKAWDVAKKRTMFYHNVMKDGILL